jgi:hypothetical protein
LAGLRPPRSRASGLGTDSDKLRDWVQLSSGSFALAERVGATAMV